jgi:signal transduction histidine kinase
MAKLAHLSSSSIDQLFPTQADRDRLSSLLAIVRAKTSQGERATALRENIDELAGPILKLATALYEREVELEKANTHLKRINSHYMEVLGFVTHEIKNHLGMMLGSSYNLSSGELGELNERQRDMLDILLRNGERLNVMIKDYLDLSRIERGELQVRKEQLPLRKRIVEPVLAELRAQLETNKMYVELDIPITLEVMADPDLLEVVMENLLHNAIKYGRKEGKIRVVAESLPNGRTVYVWNEGAGIPREKAERLFTKFGRLGGEASKNIRGTGLGLFVTREIIQKHGGEIKAESEEGKWVSFIFTLPRE